MMVHKGYTGALDVDADADLITGVVLGTTDVITFQGATVAEARKSFVESVDFYLEMCRTRGKTPEKPFSGRFVVSISPELHRALAVTAEARRMSLNDLAREVFSLALGLGTAGVSPDLAASAPQGTPGSIPGKSVYPPESSKSQPGPTGRVSKRSGATG